MEMQGFRAQTLGAYLEALRDTEARGITFIDSPEKEQFLSYAQLWKQAVQVVGHLQRKGVKPGDELVFQIPDNSSFVQVLWACILGRIVPVPISMAHKPEALEKLMKTWAVLRRPSLVAPQEMVERIAPLLREKVPQLAEGILAATLGLEDLFAPGEAGQPVAAEGDDLCYIQFSSGSTGAPKGVMLSHRNLIANIEDMIAAAGITPVDKVLSWLPLTHDMGLIGQHLRPLCLGLSTYLMSPEHFMRHPLSWIGKAAEHRATLLCAPNFGFQYFLGALAKADPKPDWDLSCLRLVFNGAEPISLPVVTGFVQALQPYGMSPDAVYPVYGLAEASLAASHPPHPESYRVYHIDRYQVQVGDTVHYLDSSDHPFAATFFDTGLPMPQCPLRIVDGQDQPLPEDTIGHIQMRGPNVCMGYYRNEKATQALFTEEGWCRTGDIGFMHQGRLCITGRAKEMIIIRGQNYFPSDLEDALTIFPETGPGKVAVCGYTNEQEGSESLVAFVAWKQPLADFLPVVGKVKQRMNQALGLSVEEVIPIRTIQRTTSGKVQRYAMVQQWQQGRFDADLQELRACAAHQNDWLQQLSTLPDTVALATIADVLYVEAQKLVPLDAAAKTDRNGGYFSTGFDSLKLTRYQGAVEKQFAGLKVPISLFFKYRNIPSMAHHLYQEVLVATGNAKATSSDPLMEKVAQLSDAEIAQLLAGEE